MLDLLLINPSLELERRREDFQFPYAPHSRVPQWAICLAPYVKREGFSLKVLDFEIISSSQEDQLLARFARDARFVGISAMTAQVPHALALTRKVKEIAPGAKTIWGGVHATLFPGQTAAHESVDYVVYGEGEVPLGSILTGRDHDRVGTAAVPVAPERRNLWLAPEQLPDPGYEDLDLERYFALNGGARHLGVLTSRGCSFRCSFCINTVCENKWRGVGADRAIGFLADVHSRYGLTHLHLLDEHFVGRDERCRSIVEFIASIDATWEANVRIDILNAVDDDLLRLFRDSGMLRVRMGAESGSNRMLQLMRKNITRDDILRALDRCLRFGLTPMFSFMIGLPDETSPEKQRTIRLARHCRHNGAIVIGPQPFRPYPGSEEFNKMVARGLKVPRTLEQWAESRIYSKGNVRIFNEDEGLASTETRMRRDGAGPGS